MIAEDPCHRSLHVLANDLDDGETNGAPRFVELGLARNLEGGRRNVHYLTILSRARPLVRRTQDV